jgi:hypothetical protein
MPSLSQLFLKAYVRFSGINGRLRLEAKRKREFLQLRKEHYRSIRRHAAANTAYLQQSQHFLMQNFCGYRDTSWHLCFTWVNGRLDENYIPEDIFYDLIEPLFNPRNLATAYVDKNAYQKFLAGTPMPRTAFRIVRGRLLDADYQPISLETLQETLDPAAPLFLKPSINSGGGHGIFIDSAANILAMAKTRLAEARQPMGLNYICQHRLPQSPDIAKLHASSLNTIRVMTFRSQAGIVVLSAVLRMGRQNQLFDNVASGGISCGINDGTGCLKPYAYDKHYNRFAEHPDTGVSFDEFKLPGYQEVLDLCIRLHGKLLMFDLVSWDMAVDNENKPCMIEFNLGQQGINFLQIHNGPLFGAHTAEMIERLRLQ